VDEAATVSAGALPWEGREESSKVDGFGLGKSAEIYNAKNFSNLSLNMSETYP